MREPTATSVHRTPEAIVQANRIEICWDSFGDERNPPVILLMGMGAQMIGWDDEFCIRLAARGSRVIRLDNRDVGKSTWFNGAGRPDVIAAMTRAYWRLPVTAPYLLDDMARDVIGLMDALGIRKAHVVGASMGGTIAQSMAIHHPERVLSMTSIMSTTGDPDLPKAQASAVSAVMRRQPSALNEYVERYVDTYRILRVGGFPEEVERDRARAVRIHARGLNPQGGARQLLAILASGSRRKALRAVSVPALVIHGSLDPLVPLAAGIDTANSIPDAQMMVLEDMGHTMPMALWPRIVNAIVGVAARVA